MPSSVVGCKLLLTRATKKELEDLYQVAFSRTPNA